MRKITLLMIMISALLLTYSHLTTLSLCSIVYADDKPKQQKMELSDADKDFLRKCEVFPDDIDVIPNLPSDGLDRLELVLESKRKNCDMEAIKSFKATREFLKKYIPPPDKSYMPPKGYSRDFLTAVESKYINDINKRILDKAFEQWNQQLEKKN
jgi:hypothetical protein